MYPTMRASLLSPVDAWIIFLSVSRAHGAIHIRKVYEEPMLTVTQFHVFP